MKYEKPVELIQIAAGVQLDVWAQYLGRPKRQPGEPDDIFRRGLIPYADWLQQRVRLSETARDRKAPQAMSLSELFDHVAVVNDAIRAALASHPGMPPREG